MKRKIKYLIPLLITIFFSMILIYGVNFTLHSKRYKNLIGKELPIIQARSIFNYKSLDKNINENNFAIHFFASWCGHCIKEHYKLLKLRNDGIPIYGIALRENYKDIMKFLSVEGNPFKDVALDQDSVTSISLGVKGVPEIIIIQDNIIVDRFIGEFDENEILQYFKF